jgi:hypothetical protein
MRLLAISFMLPPMLYPQAIQIGRLLEGCNLDLVTVNGRFLAQGQGPKGPDFGAGQRFIQRLEFGHQAPLSGIAHRLAMWLLPFYGRSPDEFLAWSQAAVQGTSAWLQQNPCAVDLMASFGEPMSDHLVGLSLKRATGLPWLAHFSDPWVDNPFRSMQPLANWRNRQLEAAVVAEADSLVFTSDETCALVMAKYPTKWRDKAFVLPHSFNPQEFHRQQQEKPSADVVLRYLGNFYGHRTPFPLFLALDRLYHRDPQALQGVRVELVGATPRWMRWHPALRRLPPGLVAFHSPVPYRHSLELMQAADLLLVIDAPARHSVFLPSKLVDYIGARKPILGIVPPGASRRLIDRMGGHAADPRAPHDVDRSLLEAIAVARAVRASGAHWGDAQVRAGYEIGKLAADFREILEWTRRKGGW